MLLSCSLLYLTNRLSKCNNLPIYLKCMPWLLHSQFLSVTETFLASCKHVLTVIVLPHSVPRR